jgi:hypothetical protein
MDAQSAGPFGYPRGHPDHFVPESDQIEGTNHLFDARIAGVTAFGYGPLQWGGENRYRQK